MAGRLPLLGAHVPRRDPLAEAARRGAEVIQVHLSAPRNWAPPATHGDEDALADSDLPIFVHAPYLVNPASADPAVRARSRACLEAEATAAARIGAAGLVVHGGQTGPDTDPDEAVELGVERWVATLRDVHLACRLLVENTAGGAGAVARTPEGLGSLVEALRNDGHDVGVVLDTCHAHAAGLDLTTVAGELVAATGGIDLVHANDSHDPPGSGRDHHEHLGRGQANPDALAIAALATGAPVVVETPGGADAHAADIAWLRQQAGDGHRPAPGT